MLKLLNESLANDSRLDEHGVAYSILPLTSAFYRKLNNGTVDQCVYTRLQQHAVWSNMQFWEMSFYSDVQRSIRPVYLSNEEFAAEQEKENSSSHSDNSSSGSSSCNNNDLDGIESCASNGVEYDSGGGGGTDKLKFNYEKLNLKSPLADLHDEAEAKLATSDFIRPAAFAGTRQQRPDNLNLLSVAKHKIENNENKSSRHLLLKKAQANQLAEQKSLLPELNLNLYSRPAEKTALEICGEQMERVAHLTAEQRENFIRNEQGIIRSHVLHYITQMVNMMIPLDINNRVNAAVTAKKNNQKQQTTAKVESPTSEPTTPHSHSFNEEFNANDSMPNQLATSRKSLPLQSKRNSSMLTHAVEPNDNESLADVNTSSYTAAKPGFEQVISNEPQPDDNLSITASDTDSGYDPTAAASTAISNQTEAVKNGK